MADLPYAGFPFTATEIVQNIQAGKPGWTAENVVTAFAIRASEAHEKTNCLTESAFFLHAVCNRLRKGTVRSFADM